jgi:hypothetical protein
VTAVVLPFVARRDKQSLSAHGIVAQEVFTAVARCATSPRERMWVVPNNIAGSVFTRYSSADAACTGFARLSEAVDAISFRVSTAKTPTYTHWYIPFVDAAEHVHGPAHPEVRRQLLRVQRSIMDLAGRLGAGARIVVTADHGQILSTRHILSAGDPLLSLLVAPPSCDHRTPAFHVRAGRQAEFASMFRERFGGSWALLTSEEVESLELLGPGTLGETTHERLGDFLAVTKSDETFWYEPEEVVLGAHGGLHEDEMRVPLILH